MSEQSKFTLRTKYTGRLVTFTFRKTEDTYQVQVDGKLAPVEKATLRKVAACINDSVAKYGIGSKPKVVNSLMKLTAVDHRLVSFVIEFVRKKWPFV